MKKSTLNKLVEEVESEIVSEVEDFAIKKVKKKLIKIGEVSVFFLLAAILIVVGIAQIIAFYFPVLDGGFSFLLMGVIFLLLALFGGF